MLQLRNLVQHEWELFNDRLKAYQEREKSDYRDRRKQPLTHPLLEHSDHRKKHTNSFLAEVKNRDKKHHKPGGQRHTMKDFRPSQPLYDDVSDNEDFSEHHTSRDNGNIPHHPRQSDSPHSQNDPAHRHHPLPLSPVDGTLSGPSRRPFGGSPYRSEVSDGPPPPERRPKAVPLAPVRQQTLVASSHSAGSHRQHGRLGSGNYIILRGGSFTDAGDPPGLHGEGPSEYHFPHPGPRPSHFENFRDFAEFAHGSRRTYTVVAPDDASPAAAAAAAGDSIQDLLTGGSEPIGHSSPGPGGDSGSGDSTLPEEEEDPMLATF